MLSLWMMEQQRVLGAAGGVKRLPLCLRACLTAWLTAVRLLKVRPRMRACKVRQEQQQQISMRSSLLQECQELQTRTRRICQGPLLAGENDRHLYQQLSQTVLGQQVNILHQKRGDPFSITGIYCLCSALANLLGHTEQSYSGSVSTEATGT